MESIANEISPIVKNEDGKEDEYEEAMELFGLSDKKKKKEKKDGE